MKLLIAEDDKFFQKLLQQVLSPEHEIIVAQNGNEAWAILQRPDAPRFAILDWVMPGLSGPEICRRVRACPHLSSMYLIILTAKNNEADIVSGLRAGADDYITKPPIPAELHARVKTGERILALQDAVAKQSASCNHESASEKLLGGSLDACPPCEIAIRQDLSAGNNRLLELTPYSSASWDKAISAPSRLTSSGLENSHSRR